MNAIECQLKVVRGNRDSCGSSYIENVRTNTSLVQSLLSGMIPIRRDLSAVGHNCEFSFAFLDLNCL